MGEKPNVVYWNFSMILILDNFSGWPKKTFLLTEVIIEFKQMKIVTFAMIKYPSSQGFLSESFNE